MFKFKPKSFLFILVLIFLTGVSISFGQVKPPPDLITTEKIANTPPTDGANSNELLDKLLDQMAAMLPADIVEDFIVEAFKKENLAKPIVDAVAKTIKEDQDLSPAQKKKLQTAMPQLSQKINDSLVRSILDKINLRGVLRDSLATSLQSKMSAEDIADAGDFLETESGQSLVSFFREYFIAGLKNQQKPKDLNFSGKDRKSIENFITTPAGKNLLSAITDVGAKDFEKLIDAKRETVMDSLKDEFQENLGQIIKEFMTENLQ